MQISDIAILVVDDIESQRVQIRGLLHNFGFKNITTCDDAAQATASLQNNHFDLILCDWHLGEVSGLTFLTYVRTQSRQKEVAFIMVTSEADKDRVVEAIRAGVDEYLIKPLTVSQIQETLFEVLLKKKII